MKRDPHYDLFPVAAQIALDLMANRIPDGPLYTALVRQDIHYLRGMSDDRPRWFLSHFPFVRLAGPVARYANPRYKFDAARPGVLMVLANWRWHTVRFDEWARQSTYVESLVPRLVEELIQLQARLYNADSTYEV